MNRSLRHAACALLIACGHACTRADRPPEGAEEPAAQSPPAPPPPPTQPSVGTAAPHAIEPPGPQPPGQPPGAAGDTAGWTARDTRVERPAAGVATLRRIEAARHEGFDRIVLDFGADPVPSWRISYIDRPVRQCGSGDVVPLPGHAWLEVHTEPARAHTDAGAATIAERHRRPRLPALLEVVLTCDFEAHVTWVAAVPAPERYRVLELSGPSRLVVDVRHPPAR